MERVNNSIVTIKSLSCITTGLPGNAPLYFGNNIENEFLDELKKCDFDKLFLITDPRVYNLYGRDFITCLNDNKMSCKEVVIPEGEINKSFSKLEYLCESLITKKITKDSIIIAFGGGLIGNITGLAAALVYRGIRFIEIPTTLMAQTDSALSNKQAVNGRNGKNQFGVYYAPVFIWVDTRYLVTETVEHTKSAIVEGIKNALISNKGLLDYFDEKIIGNVTYNSFELHEMSYEFIRSKLDILQKDPTEKKYGVVLEYGHTFGHAIEWLSSGNIIHGFAVAIGMCSAAELAFKIGILSRDAVDKHYYLFKDRLGVTLSIPSYIKVDNIISTILLDNKRTSASGKFVLLKEIGECYNPDGDFLVAAEPKKIKETIEKFVVR